MKSLWRCLDCSLEVDAERKQYLIDHPTSHLWAEYPSPPDLSEQDFRSGLARLFLESEERIAAQDGFGNFFDNGLLNLANALKVDAFITLGERRVLISLVQRHQMGRFVDYFVRKGISGKMAQSISGARDLFAMVMTHSQGNGTNLRWKGYTLFKTAFDLGIYQQMIEEIRPRTIIELGSGGSAVWLADVAKMLDVPTQVLSFDIKPPAISYPGVRFVQADCNNIEQIADEIKGLPHPWLVIEDAHVNVLGVMTFFDQFMRPGDYLVVEDSFIIKENAMGKFLFDKRDRYLVDTKYVDLFGENMTCSVDSIFKRV
ncbi:MAG: CmcI family methyltransferase [Candidatus Methanoperedens sp.]|nr:CmcI family methyltransferase [Candidatus Methanoperedens sp.]